MTHKSVQTAWAKIYIAGSIETAKQVCRKHVFEEGLCVTVDPTTYIYTGGEEAGVVIGLINYPKYESYETLLHYRAMNIAHLLIQELCQRSATVMTNERTTWISL
jgi:hypothetical protein